MSRSVSIWKPKLIPIGVFFCVVLNGCASVYKPQPQVEGILRAAPERPQIGEVRKKLRSLPTPAGRITTAVYGFGDLTGQNKPSPASGLSTAVTQGASSSLVGLMLESGWFRPVERVGLQSVLSERSLWEQRLGAQNRGRLEPLPPASIIFEGGIVAYEFNTRTGGIGAKILGIGGSKEYREDVLTVSLRVVNAQSGLVLNSVTSTKRIYSHTVNTSLFGFVDNDIIAEAEGGWASNESVQAGLEEAIAFALIDLIADGLTTGTWQLSNPEDIRSEVFTQFLAEEDIAAYLSEKSSKAAVPPEVTKDENTREVTPSNGLVEPSGEVATAIDSPAFEGGPPDTPQMSDATATLKASDESDEITWTENPLDDNPVVNEVASQKVTTANSRGAGTRERISSQVATELPSEVSQSESNDASRKVTTDSQEGSNVVSNGGQSTTSPGATKQINYLVVGHLDDPSLVIDFQRWLDDRYDGVDVTVIKSADKSAFQVAIGPFDDASDVGLVATDLQGQGIPIVEVAEKIDSERYLPDADGE